MKHLTIFALTCLWWLPCAAQQAEREKSAGQRTHLLPVDPAYGTSALYFDYPKIVTTVFHEAYAENVRARVYITAGGPGAVLSDMLYLQQSGTDYRLVYLHPLVPLWQYSGRQLTIKRRTLPKNDPVDYHDLKPWRCERSISAPIAERVIKLWKRVLLETRYNLKWERGLDGGDYLFSMEVPYEGSSDLHLELAGTVWSPDENTKPGMLVRITEALRAQCVPELSEGSEPIEPLIEKLEAQFSDQSDPRVGISVKEH